MFKTKFKKLRKCLSKAQKNEIVRGSRETDLPLLFTNSEVGVFNVCVTRWFENLDGYNHFLLTYPFIIEALEVIAHKLHLEKYLNWSHWNNESWRRVASARAGISSFEFCVVFTTIVKSHFFLRGPTKKIQGRSLDLYVFGRVMVARDDLVFARNDEGKKVFCTLFRICIGNC